MAVNPMQRRARNSFLIGFLVALIIMALVVVFLLTRIKALNEEKEALINERSEAIVCTTDLDSGAVVTFEGNFTQKTVITDVPRSEMVSIDDFLDETEDGSEAKEVTMKIAVPSGTIVTKDMIQDSTDILSDTQRIQEYNMILLPSHLKNGDYVDVRLSLPNGQDYIVLTKKRVLGTDATTVWFKLDEMEINLLNSAIVESYTINGSKLYAIEYVEPGLQEPTIKTYTVSQDVFNLINSNPNILEEVKREYMNGYDSVGRVTYFETLFENLSYDDRKGQVNTGNSNEREAIKAARQSYVEGLEGTDSVGYQASGSGE